MNTADKLNFQSKIIDLKQKFLEEGVVTFPKEQLIAKCPYKNIYKVNSWITNAQNVWNKYSINESVLTALEEVYKDVKNQ